MSRNLAVAAAVWLTVAATPLLAVEVYAPLSTEAARQAAIECARTRPDYRPEAEPLLAEIWQSGASFSPTERLDAVVRTFYIVDPEVRRLVDACAGFSAAIVEVDFPALHTGNDQPFYVNNIRAFYARYLAMLRLYDEALDLYAEIDPSHLVDPAGSLFLQAVCEHALLRKDDGLKTITRLLENTSGVPSRYATVASLMRHDLEALQEKSLNEVAQQMRDVERRLGLGHAGQRVQRQEERIISTLDEIIEKLEQQQGGGGGGGGQQGSPRGNPSGSPAEESYVGGVKGPGEVDPKSIGHKAGWGNLPEKEEAQVKNMLDTQFPSNYRQAVSEYLKKLGQRTAPARN